MLPTFPTRTRSYSSFVGLLLFAGLLAGAGNVVFLTVRYNAGLTNIVDENEGMNEVPSLQHEVISVGVGYTFAL